MFIVGLVEEDILPVPLRVLLGPIFQVARGRDTVLGAELLPELCVSSAGDT
jgi:hypothetical protein